MRALLARLALLDTKLPPVREDAAWRLLLWMREGYDASQILADPAAARLVDATRDLVASQIKDASLVPVKTVATPLAHFELRRVRGALTVSVACCPMRCPVLRLVLYPLLAVLVWSESRIVGLCHASVSTPKHEARATSSYVTTSQRRSTRGHCSHHCAGPDCRACVRLVRYESPSLQLQQAPAAARAQELCCASLSSSP